MGNVSKKQWPQNKLCFIDGFLNLEIVHDSMFLKLINGFRNLEL